MSPGLGSPVTPHGMVHRVVLSNSAFNYLLNHLQMPWDSTLQQRVLQSSSINHTQRAPGTATTHKGGHNHP